MFLFPFVFTERYYFMEVTINDFDFSSRNSTPPTRLVYDRQEKSMFTYRVYNDDYSNESRGNVFMMGKPLNNVIAFSRVIWADVLIEAYEKGQLKGKLKEIAAGLKEEDNPVIMLVKHKK